MESLKKWAGAEPQGHGTRDGSLVLRAIDSQRGRLRRNNSSLYSTLRLILPDLPRVLGRLAGFFANKEIETQRDCDLPKDTVYVSKKGRIKIQASLTPEA